MSNSNSKAGAEAPQSIIDDVPTSSQTIAKPRVSGSLSCFRIVSDSFKGFEVQKKKRFLFWTWWVQCRQYKSINTFSTVDEAKNWIDTGCPKDIITKEGRTIFWVSPNCR